MTPLQIAVVGGGHLGTIHAKLLARVEGATLAAIVEPSSARADELSRDFDCPIVPDVEPLVAAGKIDGAVIAAPTPLHCEVGTHLLGRGIHTLIEKPLAPTAGECETLVQAANEQGCVLQVGHVERFNPAWTTMCDAVGTPRLIDAVREGPLTFRSMDTGVVLDLMIHDIDLVLSFVRSPVVAVQATGIHWTGAAEDVAQARVTFANGTVARFSASRVSQEPQRQMRLFGNDWLANVDFGSRHCSIVRAPRERDWQTRQFSTSQRQQLMQRLFDDVLPMETPTVPEANPILDELRDFVTSIKTESTPIVSGQDGWAAVDVAQQVLNRISQRVSRVPGLPSIQRKAG